MQAVARRSCKYDILRGKVTAVCGDTSVRHFNEHTHHETAVVLTLDDGRSVAAVLSGEWQAGAQIVGVLREPERLDDTNRTTEIFKRAGYTATVCVNIAPAVKNDGSVSAERLANMVRQARIEDSYTF